MGCRGTRNAVALGGVVLACLSGCSSGSDRPPSQLVDGSKTKTPSVRLDAPNPQILTDVVAIDARDALVGTAAGKCLRAAREHRARAPIVVRTGVAGISVTFRTASGRGLAGCDGSHVAGTDDGPWCGRAYGRVEKGRLLDPRLDLAGCTTSTGDGIAFAWLTPGPETAYLAVRQDGYTEVYRVAGRIPIRVTTADIAQDRSAATFEFSEHASNGALLRMSRIEVRVAG